MQQKELLVYAKALFYLNQIYIPFASRKSLIRFVQTLLKYSAETLPRMGLISLLVAGTCQTLNSKKENEAAKHITLCGHFFKHNMKGVLK